MKQLVTACALIALAACSPRNHPPQENPPQTQDTAPAPAASAAPAGTATVPAGAYALDKSHASLIFRVSHLGFSNYTARFKRFDAQLQFDPANLAASSLTATIDARSIETDFPDPAKVDFNAQLQSEQWLDTARFAQMTFRSTQVEPAGTHTVRVHGDLSLRGVTRPIVLDARFNGGYEGNNFDPQARIGFSAHGSLKRSEFGVSFGIPEPGSTFGVGDEVEILIEAEFTGPPWAGAQRGESEES